jgi:hypothetical protein
VRPRRQGPALLRGPSTSPLDAAMSRYEVPKSVPLAGASAETRPDRPLLALALNVLGVFLYFFGLIAPLTPSHGHPAVWVMLIFVGGPIALVWVASRCISSTLARFLLYIEILLIASFACYLLLVVERSFR